MASDLVTRWLDSFNSRAFATEDLYTRDATLTEGGPTAHGPEEIREYFKGYVAAFPDGREELISSVESPDRIAIEARFIGTNTGPMYTPGGFVPATGKSLDWAFVAVLDLENGKIKAHRGYGDQVVLRTQLGLM